MKIELSDEKIKRMAQAIRALELLADKTAPEYEDIPLAYVDATSTTSAGRSAHKSVWKTLKPIYDRFNEQAQDLTNIALSEIRDELRRIADGGDEV